MQYKEVHGLVANISGASAHMRGVSRQEHVGELAAYHTIACLG